MKVQKWPNTRAKVVAPRLWMRDDETAWLRLCSSDPDVEIRAAGTPSLGAATC